MTEEEMVQSIISDEVLTREGFKVVVWDLDSTLCRTVRRRWMIPLINDGLHTWDDYSELCVDDEPIPGTVGLSHLLDFPQLALSARSAHVYDETKKWLDTYDVPIYKMVLRDRGSRVPITEWKVGILRKFLEAGIDVSLMVEDSVEVSTAVMQELKIPVLTVAFEASSTDQNQSCL